MRAIQSAFSRWASARIDRKICIDGAFWLFILGVNNSGTTILSKILERHKEIRTLPAEGQLLTTALPRPDLLGVERLWTSRMDLFQWAENDDPRPALQAKRDWVGLYTKNPGILLEKSPPNTVRSLWLQRNFTPSRFLSIVRNPYAVCEGIRRRKQCDIQEAARHWTTANSCLLDDLEMIEKNLFIKYEELVDSPENTLMKLQQFLDLRTAFNDDHYGDVNAHSMEGSTVGLKNLNEESFSRLSASDIRKINSLCGTLMNKLGYSMRDKL